MTITGSTIDAANSTPAIGVAMKFCTSWSAACMRLFARSSPALPTMLGTIATVALS